MADDKVVLAGWKTGQPEARGSNVVAEAICELMRELTNQLDTSTSHALEELQGQLDVLESLIKTQQLIGQKMTWQFWKTCWESWRYLPQTQVNCLKRKTW
ncbi:hypothetical protein ID866_9126 [Astraeus odoratus]|nr:hypothetical protein ID866_9126 [Astraeus odoratus]